MGDHGEEHDRGDDHHHDRGDDHHDHNHDDHNHDDHHDHADDHHDDHHDHNHHDHADDHNHHDHADLGVAVLTVSSSRGPDDDDPAGDAISELVRGAGHDVVVRRLVDDDTDEVRGGVRQLVDRDDVDCVVSTGGTGVTPDDVTVEAVEPLLEKRLPGFGELFRTLSYEEIGTRVVGTRATAGVVDGVVVCCLPGSEAAARLGTDAIVLEEAPHLVGLARR